MLLTKRFLPYFATQCLGALNDNIYKNVLLLLVTFSQVKDLPISVDMFVNLAAGVFILPFFLFRPMRVLSPIIWIRLNSFAD